MNAPGSPSSPLQMTYLARRQRAADDGPFGVRREAGAAAAAQAAACEPARRSARASSSVEAASQGRETVVAQVLVEVERIDLAAVLGGQVLLRTEERADRRLRGRRSRGCDGRVVLLVGEQPVRAAAMTA